MHVPNRFEEFNAVDVMVISWAVMKLESGEESMVLIFDIVFWQAVEFGQGCL